MKIRNDSVEAGALAAGTAFRVPMTAGEMEPVRRVDLSDGYATVETVEGSRFQWKAEERITTSVVLEDDDE
jgi:hypothetical protein